MSDSTLRYWLVCVGQPVPFGCQETGRFAQLIAMSDGVGENFVKNCVGNFLFPAGMTMTWKEFREIPFEVAADVVSGSENFSGENGHIKLWLVSEKP